MKVPKDSFPGLIQQSILSRSCVCYFSMPDLRRGLNIVRKKITVCQWAMACSSLRLTSRLKSTGKSVGKFLFDPKGCSNSGECESFLH